MAEWIKVNIIENAHMSLDNEDIALRLVFIEDGHNYYEIAISKTMNVNYIRLVKSSIREGRGTSERLQFSIQTQLQRINGKCLQGTYNS